MAGGHESNLNKSNAIGNAKKSENAQANNESTAGDFEMTQASGPRKRPIEDLDCSEADDPPKRL